MRLDHLSFPEIGWGYMPPTEEIYRAFSFCQNLYNPKSVLEIGFHLGHSTTYQLEIFKNAKVTSVSPYVDRTGRGRDRIDPTERWKMALKLHEIYGDRWMWIPGKTHMIEEEISIYKYDFALVDGGHSYPPAFFDMNLCVKLGIKRFLIDNFELVPVRDAFHDTKELKLVKVFYYNQTFKGKTKKNQIALVEVDNPQHNLL